MLFFCIVCIFVFLLSNWIRLNQTSVDLSRIKVTHYQASLASLREQCRMPWWLPCWPTKHLESSVEQSRNSSHHHKSQSTNTHNTSTTTSHTQQLDQKSSTRSTRHLSCKAMKLCKWTMGTTIATPPPSTQSATNNQAQHINHKTKRTHKWQHRNQWNTFRGLLFNMVWMHKLRIQNNLMWYVWD